MDAGASTARWFARRRAQHRTRGGRPAPAGGARRQARPALDRARRSHPRLQLFRAGRGNQPVCQRPGPTRSHQGRQGLFAARQDTGTLLRGSRHPEERKRIFTPVLGVRARTDQSPHVDRQCQSPRHIRSILPPQDRALAQRASRPGANLPDQFLAHSPARHDRPSSRDGSGIGFVRDRVDRARRHGVVALHQRHDRTSEGGRARARGRRGTSYHRPPRTRPQTG